MTARHIYLVTLNLFQGPFRGLRRSSVSQRGRAVVATKTATGCAARWMLKQVQHDDLKFGLV